MFGLGPLEIVVIGAIAVMLYGRRLPEVGRSFGRTVGDLRKQWTSLARELDVVSELDGRLPSRTGSRTGASAAALPRGRVDGNAALLPSPRFEPPPADGAGEQAGDQVTGAPGA
jgi:sec-independent protein translocase protein TatA